MWPRLSPHRRKLTKRQTPTAMALSLAALILHEITPEWDRGGNCEYFSVASRWAR